MHTHTRTQQRQMPTWQREALYYADRPSRRMSSDDIETVLAGVMLDASGGRVRHTPFGEL